MHPAVLLKETYRHVRGRWLPHALPAARGGRPDIGLPVRVVGLFSQSSGIGRSAELCVQDLLGSGIDVHKHDVSAMFGPERSGILSALRELRADPEPCTCIYHLNPPKMVPAMAAMGRPAHRRAFNIGYWAWELPTLPREWIRAARLVDAILVPSGFVRSVFVSKIDKPVYVVPHPVHVGETIPFDRKGIGADSDTFMVVNVFSFASSSERKNPAGAIKAFRAAFGPSEDVCLVLKHTDGDRHPKEMQALRQLAENDPRVVFLGGDWEQARLHGLVEEADLLLSLHRAEGFGLPIAEAMLLGTPVLATGWSGNMEFCTARNCALVNYKLAPVTGIEHPDLRAARDAEWAEPDLEDAANWLRTLLMRNDLRRDFAAFAKRDVEMLRQRVSYLDVLTDLAGIPAGASLT